MSVAERLATKIADGLCSCYWDDTDVPLAVQMIQEEIDADAKEQEAKVDLLESSIACATDLLNTWARESGVAESHDTNRSELALRELVDRIWSRVSEVNHQRVQAAYAYQDDKVRELVRACRVVLDNLGCNHEGELEEALKPFEAATAQGE